MDDIDMLIKVIDGRGTIADAFPGVKYVILINASDENIKEGTIFHYSKNWKYKDAIEDLYEA